MGGMVNDVGACIDQPNDSQYRQYGSEGAFQVHDFVDAGLLRIIKTNSAPKNKSLSLVRQKP